MIVIDKWAGLATNASPYSIPPGSAVTQVNLQIIAPGQVSVRPGLQSVTFSSYSATTGAIRCAFRYPGDTESILHQAADGSILIARGPS